MSTNNLFSGKMITTERNYTSHEYNNSVATTSIFGYVYWWNFRTWRARYCWSNVISMNHGCYVTEAKPRPSQSQNDAAIFKATACLVSSKHETQFRQSIEQFFNQCKLAQVRRLQSVTLLASCLHGNDACHHTMGRSHCWTSSFYWSMIWCRSFRTDIYVFTTDVEYIGIHVNWKTTIEICFHTTEIKATCWNEKLVYLAAISTAPYI